MVQFGILATRGIYCFFVTSSAWGIAVSQIDKGDVENLPFPELTREIESGLAAAWDEAATLESNGKPFSVITELLDQRVTTLFEIPESVSLVVREFFHVRYRLNQGKTPSEAR